MSLGDPYAHDPGFSHACDQAREIEALRDRLAEQARRLEILGARARLQCGHEIGQLVLHEHNNGSHCAACLATIQNGLVAPPSIGPYDEESDSLLIEGTRYGASLFRNLSVWNAFAGDLIRIEARADDGTITLRRYSRKEVADTLAQLERAAAELRQLARE